MKIEHINFYAYSLPLKTPLKMMGTIQKERLGFIIEIVDSDGFFGWGDIAPFPGLHKEKLSDIITSFKKRYNDLAEKRSNDYKAWLVLIEKLYYGLPSLNFALQTAVVNLFAKKSCTPVPNFLNPNSASFIHLNALITSQDNTEEMAENVLKQNYTKVKLKVGTRSISEEINLVNYLYKIWRGKIKLRLDANRKWSFEDALKFAGAVNKSCIDYIEEPFNDPRLCSDFFQKTGIHFALDESLIDGNYKNMKSSEGLIAFIIKPTVIGSYLKIEEWIALANQNDYQVVFSSTFESGLGLHTVANLAAAFAGKSVHGLDTFRWFNNDTILPGFYSHGAIFELVDINEIQLNHTVLRAVTL